MTQPQPVHDSTSDAPVGDPVRAEARVLQGVIRHQAEIYVVTEAAGGYVVLKTDPDEEEEQAIRIHVSNVDAVIALLGRAKADLVGAYK